MSWQRKVRVPSVHSLCAQPRCGARCPLFALPQYCDECWRGHLRVQIGEGKARHVVCMAHKCNIVCDEELVGKVMKVRRVQGARSCMQRR